MTDSIRKCMERDKRLRAQLFEVCRKTSRSQLEVFSYASEYIERENKEMYDKMNDPNTPKTERDWIRYSSFIEKFLMALAGHRDNRKNK